MADEVKSVKDEMNGKSELLPAKWNRFTVADGDWMQSKTLQPLTARDDFLADKIGESNSAWQDALSSESATRYSDDQYLSASISSLSGEFYTFSADDYYPTVTALRYDLNSEIDRATQAESTLSGRISLEETTRSAADARLQEQIDKLQAATDVIAVFGTYDEFVAGSGDLGVTDNDTIKVLRDDNYTPAATDEDYESNDDDGFQVYYEWHDPNAEEPHTDWTGWSAIGSLDPYYSVAEIDDYLDQINDEFDSLSATVANNYLSANNTAVSAGKNIIVTNEEGPKVGIKTKDDVSFTSVSATGFSGTNLSGINQHDTIDNLFGSAHSGAEASAWIYANSAILDIQPGYGLTYDINEQGNKVIGIRQDHCDYYGHSLALGSYSTANGDNSYAFGMSCVTNGSNALAIGDNARATTGAIALGTYNSAMGKYSLALGYNSTAFNEASVAIGRGLSGEAPITLGTWNDNVAGATFIIGDGTGTQEGHDVVRKNALVIKDGLVSGRDFSAGNVSLSSLTNLSAFGNGITNTATYNLSAIKLSAGQGIGFKEDTNGVLSISSEGTKYNGSTYISTANDTISITNDLVDSAQKGKFAWNVVNSAKVSAIGSGFTANSFAYLSAGLRISAGDNLTISTSLSPNTIKLDAKPSIDTYYHTNFKDGPGWDEVTGNITSMSAILVEDPSTDDHVMSGQSVIFGTTGNATLSGLLIQKAAGDRDDGYVLTYVATANSYEWKEGGAKYNGDGKNIIVTDGTKTVSLSSDIFIDSTESSGIGSFVGGTYNSHTITNSAGIFLERDSTYGAMNGTAKFDWYDLSFTDYNNTTTSVSWAKLCEVGNGNYVSSYDGKITICTANSLPGTLTAGVYYLI